MRYAMLNILFLVWPTDKNFIETHSSEIKVHTQVVSK